MAATLIKPGFIQFSGIITATEINTLGSAPVIFNTPVNFWPLFFSVVAITGSTVSVFTDVLTIYCVNNNRLYLNANALPPFGNNRYTNFGISTFGVNEQVLVQPNLPNNVGLTPADGVDPTPGDIDYKYNLAGIIVQ